MSVRAVEGSSWVAGHGLEVRRGMLLLTGQAVSLLVRTLSGRRVAINIAARHGVSATSLVDEAGFATQAEARLYRNIRITSASGLAGANMFITGLGGASGKAELRFDAKGQRLNVSVLALFDFS